MSTKNHLTQQLTLWAFWVVETKNLSVYKVIHPVLYLLFSASRAVLFFQTWSPEEYTFL